MLHVIARGENSFSLVARGFGGGSSPAPSTTFNELILIQIVHFHESNASGVAYAAHNRGVVARCQVCDNRRLACLSRSVATVLNVADLISGDDPAEYRRLPVIIGSNQCSAPVVQFQSRITQRIGDPILREL